MRAVVQRAAEGQVSVAGEIIGRLEPAPGLVVLVGVSPQDTEAEARLLADKIAGLRIFADEAGKMNLSLRDIGGGALVDLAVHALRRPAPRQTSRLHHGGAA